MRRVHYVSGDGSKHCDIVKYDNQITIMHNMILRFKKKNVLMVLKVISEMATE